MLTRAAHWKQWPTAVTVIDRTPSADNPAGNLLLPALEALPGQATMNSQY
jgi:hypothetical protein